MRLKAEMFCPDCDCKCNSDVIDTTCAKLTYGKVIRRRRVCRKCEEKFSTYEIPANEYKELMDVRAKTREMSNAIVQFIELAEKYKDDEGYDRRCLNLIGGDDDG